MSILSKAYFHDEEAAFAHLESVLWGGEPSCPRCGSLDRITKVKANPEKRIRVGLWRCGSCKRQFTVKIGTVFEHMRIPLHKALQAVYLMTASKKGVSAHQLHRILEVTYKTAWFLAHRIREAMRSGTLDTPFGSGGGAVEVDETFIGREPTAPKGRPKPNRDQKQKLVALVDRETGQARSMVVDNLRADTLAPILNANLAREARLMTDEARYYKAPGKAFASHEVVNHARKEYARGDVTTNTVEGYFSVFKRGMKGTYHHCAKKHLHRYAAEFEFRYNNRSKLGVEDHARFLTALDGTRGKRLTYAPVG